MFSTLKRFIAPRNPTRLLWHHIRSFTAAFINGFPARRLLIIGVTGTDGKTTTVSMIAHILAHSGMKVGALSTALFRIGDSSAFNATQKTSPSPFVVQKFLRRLVREGCTHAVLEFSSHGLVQGRNAWTWPRVAAITNTSFEHLDYHGSMEQYRRDKAILFRMLRPEGTKVLNREDETFHMYSALPSAQTIVYGMHPIELTTDTQLWAQIQQATSTHTEAVIHRTSPSKPDTSAPLHLPLPGSFNVENALCAIACTTALSIPIENASDALRSFTTVPGRMERIEGPQPFTVIVDFTVTPIAYERTLSSLRSTLNQHNRLLVLTGSCGDRMREKRPEIGRICSELADVVFVTNEDPYTEDPDAIIQEVWSGIQQEKTEAHRIRDRKEAMRAIFRSAKEGDIVLLSGKGSDTTMMLKDGQVPWDEREIAQSLLREMFGAVAP